MTKERIYTGEENHNGQENTLGGEEIAWTLRFLEKGSYIPPITTPKDLKTLREWGRRCNMGEGIPFNEVLSFVGERLTEEGIETLGGLENLPTFLENLQKTFSSQPTTPVEEGEVEDSPREETSNKIDPDLGDSLNRGPSSLIKNKINKFLEETTKQTAVDRVSPWVWLLNPKAAIRFLRSIAKEATIKADLENTIKKIVEIAGADAKRDVELSYFKNLEESLAPYIEPFCRERGIPVPEKDTSERRLMLLMIYYQFMSLAEKSRKIAEKANKLIGEEVEIQAETARNRMRAQELKAGIEVGKEANGLKEEVRVEKVRHNIAFFGGNISGFVLGVGSTAKTFFKTAPEWTIPVGVGIGVFVFCYQRHLFFWLNL